jgi:hypothetical protein
VVESLAEQGLARGENGLRVIMMCEIPSNAVLTEHFLGSFDSFSIGSNDMTQLTLGIDRDSAPIAADFDERDPAVKHMLSLAILARRAQDKYIDIGGQGPSDRPDLAEWLLREGIGSMSLNPDTVIATWLYLAEEAHTPHEFGGTTDPKDRDISRPPRRWIPPALPPVGPTDPAMTAALTPLENAPCGYSTRSSREGNVRAQKSGSRGFQLWALFTEPSSGARFRLFPNRRKITLATVGVPILRQSQCTSEIG